MSTQPAYIGRKQALTACHLHRRAPHLPHQRDLIRTPRQAPSAKPSSSRQQRLDLCAVAKHTRSSVRAVMAPKNKGKAKDAGESKGDAKGKLKPATSINVRHILCEKHSKKEEALEKLRNGAKFDEVAREMSEDKARQGDSFLVYFLRKSRLTSCRR